MTSGTKKIGLDMSIAERGRMFLGTFDDSVSRNPWGFVTADADNLTNTLIYHALLGPRICSRLGNILYHPPYFDALMSDSTPLIELACSGFFQFHMKGENFNDTIARRVGEETNSTLAWVASTGWSAGTDLYRRMGELERRIGENGIKQYSPSFHGAFQYLADRVVAEGTAEYREIHALWTERFPGLGRTRSEFEKLCEQRFGAGSSRMRLAMSTVNSVNHYAYALGMYDLVRRNEEEAIVETNELLSFNGVTKSLIDSGNALETDHLIELIEGEIFEVINRNLRFPVELFHDPANWRILAGLVSAAEPNREFLDLKIEVLKQIRLALEGQPSWRGPTDLEKACHEYSRFLCKTLGTRSSKLGRITMKLGLDKFMSAGTKDAAADLLSKGASGAFTMAAATAGYQVGDFAGMAAATAAEVALKTWANVVVDISTSEAVYRARRIIDRVEYDSSNLADYQQNFAPVIQALCIKQITTQAGIATADGKLADHFAKTSHDTF